MPSRRDRPQPATRRAVLAGAGLIAAADAIAGRVPEALAQAAKAPAKAAAAKPHQAIVDAARKCLAKGDVCRKHCERRIKAGDTSLAECLKLVDAMMPVCAATAKLAAADAARLKDLAKVCHAVCGDCEAECRKHAGHHAECKGCMEACQGMIAALRPLVGA